MGKPGPHDGLKVVQIQIGPYFSVQEYLNENPYEGCQKTIENSNSQYNDHPEPDQEVEFVSKEYICRRCETLFPIRVMLKFHNCPNQASQSECDTHQSRHRHKCVCPNTFNNKQDLIEHSMQHRRDLLAILGITDSDPSDACSDQADAQMSPLKKRRRGSTAAAAQMAPLPTHVSVEFVWQPPEYIDRYLDRTTERI